MNAANEVAVKAFMEGRIGFYDISEIIAETMAGVDFVGKPDLDAIFDTDRAASEMAGNIMKKYLR